MASRSDIQIAALAAGFTLGFGFLTVWEAIKQTRRNRNPLRSVYIYMLWGEIFANFAIGIIGWLFLEGLIGPSVPVLFFILFLWVFEIQLLMQIILNRIALIAEHRDTVRKMKWATAAIITAINIAVFCIWIPAHTNPPTNQLFVDINNVWDKISKVLILIVDAGLNWYFLQIVENRLVLQHGLVKYKPLIGFNAKLMIMLIGLMFLKNPVVYIQFHPVTYMVKLNIEMSMASLVVRLARGKTENDMYSEQFENPTDPATDSRSQIRSAYASDRLQSIHMSSNLKNTKGRSRNESDDVLGGIHCRTDLNVVVENVSGLEKGAMDRGEGSSRNSIEAIESAFEDDIPLHKKGVIVTERSV